MARKPRHLTPEERALWDQVRRASVPLAHREAKATDQESHGSPEPEQPAAKTDPAPRLDRIGSRAPETRQRNDPDPGQPHHLAHAPLRMDKRKFANMKRGKLRPEARLDLHGMTLAQAHPALSRFILDQAARGARLVLVITGKGKSRPQFGPIPTRLGVLRHQVPQWLAMPPLVHVVLQVAEAHVSHGGGGAYYVYLRRSDVRT